MKETGIVDKNKALKVAVRAAKEAGKILINELGKKHVEEKDEMYFKKGYRQIRSDIDVKVDSVIRKIINRSFPNYNILTEETSEIGRASEYTWVVDPLCGTIAYLRGIPNFATSIALLENKKVVLGVINDPLRNEVFYAIKGSGSFCNGIPVEVSSVENLEDSVLEVQHAVLRDKNYEKAFVQLARIVRRIRMSDSMGLGMAYVACGKVDAILNLIQPLYDFAAGMLILKEAGGRQTNFEGRPNKIELDTVRRNNILATNGKIHKQILKILK